MVKGLLESYSAYKITLVMLTKTKQKNNYYIPLCWYILNTLSYKSTHYVVYLKKCQRQVQIIHQHVCAKQQQKV